MAWIPDNSPKSVILTTQAHCEECKYNAQSLLRKVQGVYSVAINADRNTITISGTSAPKELIETLLKVSQDVEFCVKPPAHVPPSSCPSNKTNFHQAKPPPLNNCGFGTCAPPPPPRGGYYPPPPPRGGCCPPPAKSGCSAPAGPKMGCSCTGTGRVPPSHHSHGHGHCNGRC